MVGMSRDEEPRTNSPEDLGHTTKSERRPKDKAPPEEERPSAFGMLLTQIGDGELHEECGVQMQNLVRELVAQAKIYKRDTSGSLTLVLKVTAMGIGQVSVSGDVRAKMPTTKRPGSVFFATKGSNLSVENPRQSSLPFRDVAGGARTKDISGGDKPVRDI